MLVSRALFPEALYANVLKTRPYHWCHSPCPDSATELQAGRLSVTSLQVLSGEIKELRGDLDTRKYSRNPPTLTHFWAILGLSWGSRDWLNVYLFHGSSIKSRYSWHATIHVPSSLDEVTVEQWGKQVTVVLNRVCAVRCYFIRFKFPRDIALSVGCVECRLSDLKKKQKTKAVKSTWLS